MIYFTSDSHWSHKNIVRLCNRPTTAEDNNEWLISQYNSQIKAMDDVYFLGDFTFDHDIDFTSRLLSRLNGNWKFIIGNHDREDKLRAAVRKCNEIWDRHHVVLGSYAEIKFPLLGKTMLMHFPIEHWNGAHRGNIHLHGHLHGSHCLNRHNRYDVGIDGHPDHLAYSEDDLVKLIKAKNERRDCITISHH